MEFLNLFGGYIIGGSLGIWIQLIRCEKALREGREIPNISNFLITMPLTGIIGWYWSLYFYV